MLAQNGHTNFPGYLCSDTVLTAVAARCAIEAFNTICAVHIENCEGWWLYSCHGSVAEHWRLKPELSLVRLPAAAGLFTFFYFHPIISKFIYFHLEMSTSKHSGGTVAIVKASSDSKKEETEIPQPIAALGP